MSLETTCQGCGQKVVDEDNQAGRIAQCPHCQRFYTVPSSGFADTAARNIQPGSAISPIDPTNPYAAPALHTADRKRYKYGHRGWMILFLGILSLILGSLTCEILTFIAVYMAWSDLEDMKAGMMDPAGRGLVITGLVLAVSKLVLWVLFIAISFLSGFLFG